MYLQLRQEDLIAQRLSGQRSRHRFDVVGAPRFKAWRWSAIRAALLNGTILAVAWLAEAVISHLPRACVVALARILGTVGYYCLCLSGRRLRVAWANVVVAFGDSLPKAKARQIVRGSLCNLVLVALDLFWFARDKERRIRKYVEFAPGFDWGRDQQAYIGATAHFGNWEILGQALALRGYPAVTPYAAPHIPAVEQVLQHLRRGTGQELVPRTKAGRVLWRALREGRILGLLLDHNALPAHGGGFVQLFGVPVAAPLVAGRLTLRSGAPVVPIFCVPVERGYYRVYRRPELQIGDSGDCAADETAVTQWIMEQFEAEITRRPELWFWLHRRWKHIPPDAESFHTFPFYARPVRAARPLVHA